MHESSNLNLNSDQIRNRILDRLWQLANLAPEATRSSITGQIKAMSMIVAIEGLIPDRRTPAQTQPAEPPAKPQIYIGKPYRRGQHQDDDANPDHVATINKGKTAAPQVPEPEPPAPRMGASNQAPPPESNQPNSINPFIHPQPLNWTPAATGSAYDAIVNNVGPLRLSMAKGLFNRGRSNR